jgi:predicted LPLAT superfamily acyltransferase
MTTAIPKAKWTGQGRGSVLGTWIFMRIIAIAGPFAAYPLCRLVTFWYALTNRHLAAVIREFRAALGLPAPLSAIARHVYAFGLNMIDGFAFLYAQKPPFEIQSEGEDLIAELLTQGKGLILLSAHFGSWEFAGNLLADRLGAGLKPVMLDNEKESLKRVYADALARRRFSAIPVGGDGIELMLSVRRALAANEIVGFMGDRVLGTEASRSLPFLGRPARFPIGPFAIAAITGAPIVVAFTIKQSAWSYRHRVWGIIRFDGVTRANRETLILDAMRKYVGYLEDVARAHPHQWFNYYPFWDLV